MNMALVPELRFAGFDGAWNEKTLGKIANFRRGSFPQPYGLPKWYDDKNGFPFVQVYDVGKNFRLKSVTKRMISEAATKQSVFVKSGSVLITIQGSIGRIAITARDVYVDRTLLIFQSFNEPLDKFFFAYVMHLLFEVEKRIAPGGIIKTITKEKLSHFKFSFPSLPEQNKIAGFLSAVDEKLASVEAQLAGWRDYKRGMIQAIFSQSLRFKANDGSNFPDWQTVKFSEVLLEHKLKSAGTEPVYSVSVHKGLVDQIKHLGRSYSAVDTGHYNRVNFGDIIYTKSPTGNFPLGIIKQSKVVKDVIVSPLYGVFKPSTIALGTILDAYFEAPEAVWNYLNPIVQKGAKNTISCTNNNFLSNKLKLPTDEVEQQKIADALSAIDAKIQALTNRLDATREFKRGLLQKMFV